MSLFQSFIYISGYVKMTISRALFPIMYCYV